MISCQLDIVNGISTWLTNIGLTADYSDGEKIKMQKCTRSLKYMCVCVSIRLSVFVLCLFNRSNWFVHCLLFTFANCSASGHSQIGLFFTNRLCVLSRINSSLLFDSIRSFVLIFTFSPVLLFAIKLIFFRWRLWFWFSFFTPTICNTPKRKTLKTPSRSAWVRKKLSKLKTTLKKLQSDLVFLFHFGAPKRTWVSDCRN